MINVKTKKYQWIHIYNPTKKHIEDLHTKYDFHDLILEDLEDFSYENNGLSVYTHTSFRDCL